MFEWVNEILVLIRYALEVKTQMSLRNLRRLARAFAAQMKALAKIKASSPTR